jgi:hypothetical protein
MKMIIIAELANIFANLVSLATSGANPASN